MVTSGFSLVTAGLHIHLTFIDESHILLMSRREAFGRVFLFRRGGSEKALRVQALKYNFWSRRAAKQQEHTYVTKAEHAAEIMQLFGWMRIICLRNYIFI